MKSNKISVSSALTQITIIVREKRKQNARHYYNNCSLRPERLIFSSSIVGAIFLNPEGA